jgi:hypothetical protein
MLKELDLVVLNQDLPEYGLKEGDIGTIVYCYADGKAYEVEFVTADGNTIGVLTLKIDELRLFLGEQILHTRRVKV